MHIMSNIQGIDLVKLEKKGMRSGAYSTMVPAVRSKLQLKESGPSCSKEWKRAADIAGTRAVVKYTVPGPMTLVDGMVNIHYTDQASVAKKYSHPGTGIFLLSLSFILYSQFTYRV